MQVVLTTDCRESFVEFKKRPQVLSGLTDGEELLDPESGTRRAGSWCLSLKIKKLKKEGERVRGKKCFTFFLKENCCSVTQQGSLMVQSSPSWVWYAGYLKKHIWHSARKATPIPHIRFVRRTN